MFGQELAGNRLHIPDTTTALSAMQDGSPFAARGASQPTVTAIIVASSNSSR
jgi:hypothetical protein